MLPINQLIATIFADFGAYGLGLTIGWLSPTLVQMREPQSLFVNSTSEEKAWLAAMFPVSGMIFAPLITFISGTYGRRFCIIFSAIPFLINAITVVTAKTLVVLLIGRFFMGIGAAGAMINLPTYVSEIVEPRVRGTLASLLTIGYTSGITSGYIFGGYFTYKSVGWISIVVAILNIVGMYFMPETPIFLLRKNRKEEAAKSLAWFRRLNPLNLEIKSELDNLSASIQDNDTTLLDAAKQLLYTKPLRNGFLISFVMISIQGFCGMLAVHSYSVTIFLNGGATALGHTGASVVYGCIQVIGSISATFLVDRLGRKALMVSSSMGMCIFLLIMAVYFHLKTTMDLKSVEWIPVVALSLCVYIYTIGVGGVPFILLSDLLGNKVRNLATMLIIQVLFLETFFVLRLYSPISEAYGQHVLFYIFGMFSFIGCITSIVILTETKGKTSQEIIDTNYRFKHKFTITK